jgi:hypothetical protein
MSSILVTFIVFDCDSTWNSNAKISIPYAISDANNYLKSANIRIIGKIAYFPCKGTDGTADYSGILEDQLTMFVVKELGVNYKNNSQFYM